MLAFECLDLGNDLACLFFGDGVQLGKSIAMSGQSDWYDSDGTAFGRQLIQIAERSVKNRPVVVSGTKHDLAMEAKPFLVKPRQHYEDVLGVLAVHHRFANFAVGGVD